MSASNPPWWVNRINNLASFQGDQRRHLPKTKQRVFVRLDADVIAWLKARGKGYQTRMNAMLRVLMESDQAVPRVPAAGSENGVGLPILLGAGVPTQVIEIAKRGRPRRVPQI